MKLEAWFHLTAPVMYLVMFSMIDGWGDFRGLAEWFRAFSAGLRGKGFGPLDQQKF